MGSARNRRSKLVAARLRSIQRRFSSLYINQNLRQCSKLNLMTAGALDQDTQNRMATKVAMLLQGYEVYGIGTILKLYAAALPTMTFVALSEGPLVDWLRANGNIVEVVPGLDELEEGGASIRLLSKMPRAMLQARRDARKIDRVLQGRGIEVIHAHWRPHQFIAGCMRRLGYTSIWHINYTMDPQRLMGWGKKLNHMSAKWGADLILPASDAIGANWIGCGVPSITVRNAAVPLFDSSNLLPETPIRCLVAGRLEHSKGHHLAAEAVIRARKAGYDVRLDIYGGPLENNDYATALRQKIDAAGCSDAIQFLGFRSDLRNHHQTYHLGMQCRIDAEPCSLWVCETLVDGLPLVASATGGTPELVEDGVTGLLYPTDDVADLTEKLLQLVKDPARLRDMRAKAFVRGQEKFTLERFVATTMAAYRTLPRMRGIVA
jgi:glycosyltransferase involved in cell wall biosynthesis